MAAQMWKKFHKHKIRPSLFASQKVTTSSRYLANGSYPAPNTYEEDFSWSIGDPQSFWAKQALRLDWYKKWDRVLDDTRPPFTRWFCGGEINICYNALDRHVIEGNGNRKALIYDSPVAGIHKSFTYKDLLSLVKSFAFVLRHGCGVKKGDRVLIYMPMIPETIVAMLGAARLGAIHCVVFGGFANRELSVRINHVKPKVIVTASAGIETNKVINYKPILDGAIEMSTHKPDKVVAYQRPHIGEMTNESKIDLDWDLEMSRASENLEAVPVEANEPLYVLHTSGTTGTPKGIVRPSGGYAVALPWSMYRLYGMRPNETWWASSDLGWVVGHSYICYGPLLAGLTSVLYEGKPVGTPDPGQFFRLVAQHKIAMFFTAPTALRAIHQHDPECEYGSIYRIKHLRAIHSAGEHLDMETRQWAQSSRVFGVPVLDHWWQTESGWPISAQCVGYVDPDMQPPKDSSGYPVPGWDVQVVNESGQRAKKMDLGRIVVKLPLPPGSLSTFWQNDSKFSDTYFKQFQGYYDTMDAGMVMRDGQISVMSRVDDVINVSGHRISGGALEEAILDHIYIVDCAVIAVADKIKGHVPVALCCVRHDFNGSFEQVTDEIIKMVRNHVGAVAVLKKVIFVPKLPKTRSGKIPRSSLVAMAASEPFQMPVTIEDPFAYELVLSEMQKQGLGMTAVMPWKRNNDHHSDKKL